MGTREMINHHPMELKKVEAEIQVQKLKSVIKGQTKANISVPIIDKQVV